MAIKTAPHRSETKDRFMNIRIASSDREWLEQMAERQDRSLASVIRRLITQAREAEQQAEAA